MIIRVAREIYVTNAKEVGIKGIIRTNRRAPYVGKSYIMFWNGYIMFVPAFMQLPLEKGSETNFHIAMAIAGISFFLGMVFWVMAMLKKDSKELKRCFEIYNLSYESMEEDMHEYVTAYDYVFLGKRLLVNIGYEAFAVPFENIVWAYLKEEKKKGKRRKEKSFFYIYIYTDDRYERKIPVSNAQCGEVVLRKIAEWAPHILLGYTDEAVEMYQSDFNRMLEVVYQRKGCQSQTYYYNTVGNYVIRNEYAVTWKRYIEWYFEDITQGITPAFKIIWGILILKSIQICYVKNFSVAVFIFALFCIYKLFVGDCIKLVKDYKQESQLYGGKNRKRRIMVSDTYVWIQDGYSICQYNKEDFVRIKEKGDKIWLSTKNEGTIRMYKSAFVEGNWEMCKELFANPVKEEK